MFTTLTKEAMPLLRYRTGDIGRLVTGACECGRTTARLTGLRGRLDDMLIVRGVNIYPSRWSICCSATAAWHRTTAWRSSGPAPWTS